MRNITAGSMEEALGVPRSEGRFGIHDSLIGKILGEGEAGKERLAESKS